PASRLGPPGAATMAVVLAPLAGAGTTVTMGLARPATGSSALAVEQAGHRAVTEHLADRPGQQRRDGQHGELVEPLLLGYRQRVCDDDLADLRVLQGVHRRAGQ